MKRATAKKIIECYLGLTAERNSVVTRNGSQRF